MGLAEGEWKLLGLVVQGWGEGGPPGAGAHMVTKALGVQRVLEGRVGLPDPRLGVGQPEWPPAWPE